MSSLTAVNHRHVDGVEDRPLSVYDNLNGTPQVTPIYSTPIKTKYNNNNNNNNSQQYSQPQKPSPAYMNLPRVGNNFSPPSPPPPNTTITNLPINDYHDFTTPSRSTITSNRPNSDSYDSSLSRAAVKAALNEAKSRFFGLTTDPEQLDTSNTTYLLPQTRPYQNIPESSPSHPQRQHQLQEQQQQSSVFYPPQLQLRTKTPDRQEVDGGRKPYQSQSVMDLVTSPPSQVR